MTPEPAPPNLPATPPPFDSVPESAPKPMSELSRLVNVFVSPSAAFSDIARRPSWWTPIILIAIASIVYIAAFSSRVGWDNLIRQQLDQNSRMQNISGAQREQAIQLAERIAPITAYVGAAIGPLFAAFVIAVVLMFLFDNIMGSSIGLNRMLAIISYAQLPRLLVTALSILVMYLKPPDDFDLRNPLAFNLGALVPRDAPLWQRTLGASFDLFTFWMIALAAIGICAAAPRIKFGKALGGILFPWILWVILTTGYTAAMA